VTWEGSHFNDARAADLAARLSGEKDAQGIRRGGVKQVDHVLSPRTLVEAMVKNDVPRDEALHRLQGFLLGAGPLKVRLTEAGRAKLADVKTRVVEAIRAAGGPAVELLAPVPSELWPTPTDEELAAAKEAGVVAEEVDHTHDFQLAWPSLNFRSDEVEKVAEVLAKMSVGGVASDGAAAAGQPQEVPAVERSFLLPGAPIALAITLSEAGRAERKHTLELIREQAAAAGIPESTLRMTGRAVAATQLNEGVVKAAWDKTVPADQWYRKSVIGLSIVVGVGMALKMLRSVQLAAIVLGVSAFSAFLSLAIVPVTGGSMNMVVVVMPTLLFVTTLSGAIHLAHYWKFHAVDHSPAVAVELALVAAKSPCVWASLTTALGLASLVTSALRPVRDFGFYSAIGVVVSLGVVLVCLPAMLILLPPPPPKREELSHGEWEKYGGTIARHWPKVMAAVLLIGGVGVAGLTRFRTETKVIRYFPDSSRIVADYVVMERELAGIVPIEVLVRFDESSREELKFVERQQYVKRIEEKMKGLPDISGCLSLADFLPNVEPPEEGANMRVRAAYAAKSKAIEERAKNEQSGRAADFVRMAETAGEFNAAGDEIWRITAQVAVMADNHYGTLQRQIDDICRSELKGIAGAGGEKYRDATQSVDYHPGASHLVTGMVPLFMATQEELLHSLITSFMLAFVTIGAAMAWVMRNALAGLVAMLPNVLPIGFVFGVISWQGFRVDVGTVVTASIALGIAVDGTLHLINWFQIGLKEGLDRKTAVRNAIAHCGPAMLQTSLVVAFNLLMLYPAELVLVSRFGWLMAALIVAALVADLVLTPALLAGPLGALLEAGKRQDTLRSGTPDPSTDSSIAASESDPREMVAASEPAVEDHVYVVQPPKHHMDVAGGSIILRADPPGL
jgi:predicted RND superfamily exporter protein